MYHISEQGVKMYHISDQGFRCIISVTRGSDASFRLAQVQMFNINE